MLMPPNPLARNWSQSILLAALIAWALVPAVVLVRAYLKPYRNTVYPIFATAAREWQQGVDIYDMTRARAFADRFRYAPIVAVAFTPLAALSDAVGGVLWRILNIAVFYCGMVSFARLVFPGQVTLDRKTVVLLAWLLLPLGVGSMNNAQANLLVVGCLLLAAAEIMRERWNLAALCLAVPIVIKIYPLSVVALYLLVQPRLGWRVILVLVVACLAPFAAQDPGFVADSYGSWVNQLANDNRHVLPVENSYRDFHILTRIVGVPLEDQSYQLLQLAMAGLVAAVVLSGHWRGWSKAQHLRAAFDLGCCWMILFGPATENSTFALLAPTFALAAWDSFQDGQPFWKRCLTLGAATLFVGTLLVMVTPYSKSISYLLMPTGGLLVFAERLLSHCWPRRELAARIVEPAPLRLAA